MFSYIIRGDKMLILLIINIKILSIRPLIDWLSWLAYKILLARRWSE